jgi:hypothetical protein
MRIMKQGVLFSCLLFLCLSLFGCGAGGKSEEKTDGQSGRARWQSFPVEIYIDDKIASSPEATADVLAAIEFWETKASRQLFVFRGEWAGRQLIEGGLANPFKSPVNQAFHQSEWPYETSVLAMNMRVERQGKIEKSLISINDNYSFCFGLCARTSAVSFRKVVTHEMGHFLGFNHHDDPSNVMFAFYRGDQPLSTMKVDWAAVSELIR